MRRLQTADLFLPLQRKLVSLLRGLEESDWSRPTLARQWTVKDIVAHLLDTDLRRLSSQRDEYKRAPPSEDISGYDDLVAYLNRLNASWVETTRHFSPRVLTDLLEWSGPQVADLFASLPPEGTAIFSVAWAGEERSENWMDIGREYTEKWHHQAQIRDAVRAPSLNSRRWLGPVIELSMYALPYAFRQTHATTGSILVVQIEGEAGGTWHIVRESEGWKLREGEASHAATGEGEASHTSASVRLDAETAWRLFFNALGREEAAQRVSVAGDEELCDTFLKVRSVMV
jgi:uncharacterized protein (TIGR03083 family)